MVGTTSTVRMIRMGELVRIAGLSRSTIYAMVARGEFPVPRRLAGGVSGWRSDDVQDWLDGLPVSEDVRHPGRDDAA